MTIGEAGEKIGFIHLWLCHAAGPCLGVQCDRFSKAVLVEASGPGFPMVSPWL